MALANFALENPMNVAVTEPPAKTTSLEEQADFRPLARALGTVMDFPAGAVIFREGDPPRSMYVVLKGEIELSARRKATGTIREGQTLGAVSLIDETPRTTAARAVEACELAALDKEKFHFMVKRAPQFVWSVLDELGSP